MQLLEATDTDLEQVREELPEIDLLESHETRRRVAAVWSSFLRESSYERIADGPGIPGVPGCDLARHIRQVTRTCDYLSREIKDFWDIDLDRESLLAAALTHDASKLVEFEGEEGRQTELGEALMHAQLAGVRCMEAGLPMSVVYMVTYHPFTPPHVHVKPRNAEFVVLSWADLAAVDPIFFLNGLPTHLEIEKRFFAVE